MSTAEKVLSALAAHDLKKHGNEYRCNSPFRPGSNSHAFAVRIDDEEHGAFTDHVTNESGSLYQLAQRLNIELPERAPVVDTKRDYTGLEDFALAHGIAADVLRQAKWREDTLENRPCLIYQTETGERVRFLNRVDGKPTYRAVKSGYKPCWYGLDKAISQNAGLIVLCNGEISTVAAQAHGVPAFATTAGEKKLSDELLAQFQKRGYAGQVLIALDCDKTGRATAQAIAQQLPGSVVVDLQLADKGDLADFCRLYDSDSLNALKRLISPQKPAGSEANPSASDAAISTPVPDMVYAHTVAVNAIREIELDRVQSGYPLLMPLKAFHRLNGGARIIPPGKTLLVIAPTAGGKTSFLETLVDAWLRRGIGGMWRGDEWTPEEYHYRRVQRYGGIDSNRIIAHELWKQETARGVPENLKQGQRLTDNEILHYQEVSMGLAEWQGQLQYYTASRDKKTVEVMLDIMSQHLVRRRTAGEIVGFAVFDYAQLLKATSKPVDDNVVEHVFGLVKEWGIDSSIVCLLGSQVTKNASEGNRQNKLINLHDAQFLRADKAYTAIVLNTIYEDHPTEKNPDGTAKRVQTDRAIASVVKNSNGSTGDVDLLTDFERLQWLDGTVTPRMDMPERHEAHYADEA